MSMRIRGGMVAVVVLALQAGVPTSVNAQTLYNNTICTATSLNVCLDFNLTYNATTHEYSLVTTYASSTAPSGQQGYITSLGIYDLNSSSPFNLHVTSLSTSSGDVWCSPSLTANCSIQQLMGNGPATLLGGAREAQNGITAGLQVGESMTITFTATPLLSASDFASNGTLGLRGHVQSFGVNSCSMKPDTRATGNVFSVDSQCFPSTVVPEPMTVVLLATGLLGIGGVGMRRRRRGDLSPRS